VTIRPRRPSAIRTRRLAFAFATAACLLFPWMVVAQGLSGTLIGTVKDMDGGVLPGASVRISSTALIGGPATFVTNEKGQLRFLALPPGTYNLEIELPGFTTHREQGIPIGAGGTIERTIELKLAGLAESVVVEGDGSRHDARDPGFGTRFGIADIRAIPTRRASMFDFIRAAPGVSPTSPGSGTATTVSAFGSGTNENQFLIDGTNFTCPCNGIARSEPGVDFIQEIQVQSVGASAEYGNVQGAVINVVTRQGGNRFLHDMSYYGQSAGLTSQPVRLPYPGSGGLTSGYRRVRYRDFTTNLGGPVVRDRLWFFGGYQYLRDYDSQPGSDPAFPRTYEQNKTFAKLTWQLAPGWQLVQSVHNERWVNPEQPTLAKPYEATLRQHATVPAVTFGHLTHTSSSNTAWDVRAGRFVYAREDDPSTGSLTTASRFDRVMGITSGAPPQIGGLTLIRTTGKATINHYRPGLLAADHQLKLGVQVERGESHGPGITPTGVKYEDRNGVPFRAISSEPSLSGGLFVNAAAFASDAVTVGDRLTINLGVRFDHSRAISQDLHAIDRDVRQTDQIVQGLGTLYTWNLVSPRLGVTAKLSADGRTILRGSYGRFHQGVLTGEYGAFHPGVTPVTTYLFEPATGGYTRFESEVDSKKNLLLDRHMRAPRTDEYSIGVDREIRRRLALAVAYIHKEGANFIGWTDVGGEYQPRTRTLADGRTVPVFELANGTAARRYLLSNPDGYSLTYNGLVMAVDKRRSHGWQALGSYTFSRAWGLQASSGQTAAGAQSSTVALPNTPFGRDPNELTNARGRLPNDRPHILRVMGSVDIPRTGLAVAANLQHFSGKPWAATAQITLPQGDQRVFLESRGARRLSSQTLVDLRLSRPISFSRLGRVELLLDLLNALNDRAEEGLTTDVLVTETLKTNPDFGRPTVFMDPRRAMVGVRLNLGR
jgi:Carboxypeptidase regulatory-like domain/TonB dependent receptor-like, beta-barrel